MELNYREYGSGQPLLILHGLFGSSDNWQTLGKKLAEQYHVFLVDLRNHGRSPHSEEHTYSLMANDIEELIEEKFLSDIILIGHSMGGKTAMVFAQQTPELLDKLVVVDIGPKAYPPHHQDILGGLKAVDFTVQTSRNEVDQVMEKFVPNIGTRQFLMKGLCRRDEGGFGWRYNVNVLEKAIDQGNIIGDIPDKKVDVKTLFIRGEKSDYILDEDFDDIKKQFPKSEIKTISEAGHWIHAEAPDRFQEILEEFISE